MFHGHVVTFLDHRILIRDVSTGADLLVSARLIYVAVDPLVFESSLARVEHHRILEMIVSRLTECSGPTAVALDGQLAIVLARSWDFEFETLTIENLVGVKTGGSAIETDFLPRESFIVSGSHLLGPIRTLVQVGNHIFRRCSHPSTV
jgi:hypothetical protein